MTIETIPYYGWPNTLRLSHDETELLVTTDVGPRVISYRTGGRDNIFHLVKEDLGGSGEADWRMRGGHRFWLAPEDSALSYHADNHPVAWTHDATSDELVIESRQNTPTPIRKTLGLQLADDSSRVTVRHMATNEGNSPVQLATWGLSVMRPGGLEIIPQPPLLAHPQGILPNRMVVLWPYTDPTDRRWRLGTNYWFLRQEKNSLPTKLGLAHRQRWIAYMSEDLLFIKEIDWISDETYPDSGCNFETFSDANILEIESLGPLKILQPGEAVTHTERWQLFTVGQHPPLDDEAALTEWLSGFISQG